MDFQIKLFSWQDKGNHLIIIARGPMNTGAFKRLFEKIAEVTRPLKDCKVLVDLSDGVSKLETTEIDAFFARLPADLWPAGNKVALVSGPELEDYHQVYFLRTAITARGFNAGAFCDSKVAIDWLAGEI